MADYTVNQDAVRFARKLIDEGKYVLESEWSEAQPTAEQGDEYIDAHGWEAYGRWHLGLVDGASEDTKERYGFCDGDFEKIHRSGLAAAAERAGQWHHEEIEQAAHDLLEHLKSAAGE